VAKRVAQKQHSLRIISGKWRSRKVVYGAHAAVRPTPARLRETLFNWLGVSCVNALLLDLFAGSGSLGFEALSRGAKQVVFVDQEPQVIAALMAQKEVLSADSATIVRGTVLGSLVLEGVGPFSGVFLDPPFSQNLFKACVDWLEGCGLLAVGAWVYCEWPVGGQEPFLGAAWRCKKCYRSGQVVGGLFVRDEL
jgi:16S rRNA (guanine966-N2)-methyltransferase